MTPRAAHATALNPIEARLSGDLLALNRLIMTFLNKRMPVVGFTVGRDAGGMRATILLDCPPETARRYAALLSSLEDVDEIEFSEETVEVALLKSRSEEHTSELQSRQYLVCRLLLEKKKNNSINNSLTAHYAKRINHSLKLKVII